MGSGFLHLVWYVPLFLLLSLVICRLISAAVTKWPTKTKVIRNGCPYILVSILLEIAVYRIFDPASAAQHIVWVPVLHYLNLTFGVPAFMLFFFERFFRATGERSILCLIPVFAFPIPIIILMTLHEMYRGIYYPW